MRQIFILLLLLTPLSLSAQESSAGDSALESLGLVAAKSGVNPALSRSGDALRGRVRSPAPDVRTVSSRKGSARAAGPSCRSCPALEPQEVDK